MLRRLAWVHLDTNSFFETGTPGGIARLLGAGDTQDVGYSTLGVRFATAWTMDNGMIIVPRVLFAWQHAFGDVSPTAALAFQTTGAAFGVQGVPLAEDAAIVEAGLDFKVSPRMTLGVSYAGQLASDVQDHAVKGKFTWSF